MTKSKLFLHGGTDEEEDLKDTYILELSKVYIQKSSKSKRRYDLDKAYAKYRKTLSRSYCNKYTKRTLSFKKLNFTIWRVGWYCLLKLVSSGLSRFLRNLG